MQSISVRKSTEWRHPVKRKQRSWLKKRSLKWGSFQNRNDLTDGKGTMQTWQCKWNDWACKTQRESSLQPPWMSNTYPNPLQVVTHCLDCNNSKEPTPIGEPLSSFITDVTRWTYFFYEARKSSNQERSLTSKMRKEEDCTSHKQDLSSCNFICFPSILEN